MSLFDIDSNSGTKRKAILGPRIRIKISTVNVNLSSLLRSGKVKVLGHHIDDLGFKSQLDNLCCLCVPCKIF